MKRKFDHDWYQQSSEDDRMNEQIARNTSRAYKWSWTFFCHMRRFPALFPRPQEEQHGNTTVVSFPRRKRQIIGVNFNRGRT